MNKTDEVFNLENKKHQVEMSMQEREKEIVVQRRISSEKFFPVALLGMSVSTVREMW